MKKKKMISLLLCLCLTATSISPVWAVNDSEVIAAAEEEILAVAENGDPVPYAESSDDSENIQTLSESIVSGDFRYVVNEDGETATITGFVGEESGDLVIPEEIDEYTVTVIGNDAFSYCDGFTGSLKIPDSVTIIEMLAFANCIGFTGNLTIPDSVTSIGDLAFYGCTGFTGALTISDNVTYIGIDAFRECKNLESIDVDNENKYYSSEDGILYNFDKTTLITCPAGKKMIGFSIPNTVTSVEDSAFYSCHGLTGSLTIPDSITSVSAYAFYNCTGIESAYFYGDVPEKWAISVFRNNADGFIIYYPEGNTSGWTSPTWEAPDGTVYNTATFVPETTIIKYGFNRNQYAVIDEAMTWTEAKAYCESLGGHLATITSEDEQVFIEELLSSESHSKYHYWLGGTDSSDEGNWEWITGEVWEYSNWDTNQPDNYEIENYLQIFNVPNPSSNISNSERFKWNDVNNESYLQDESSFFSTKYTGLICEWESNIDEPSYIKHEFNGNQYAVIDESMTWTEAKAYCESLGGHLVTITSEEEQKFVNELVVGQNNVKQLFWIGLYRNSEQWSWVTDEPVLYMNWAEGEPNNQENAEYYAHIFSVNHRTKNIGEWNDASVDGALYAGEIYSLDNFGFICEWGDNTSIPTSISTTFDTTAATLAEGETFDFAGIVSTTAENGLEAVQIDIHKYGNDRIGITYFRKSNTDEKDPLTGDTFDLSAIPSFTGGDTLTGQTDNTITLSAGTSWNVYLYAKDTDGNTLGGSVIMRLDIVEAEENDNTFVDKKYVQTTNIDSFYGSPYIKFNDETTGEFHWVDPETGESGTDDFTYTFSGYSIILNAEGSYLLGNAADEIVLDILDKDTLEVTEIVNYSTTEEVSVGCTGVGDMFVTAVEVEQVKPEVTGLQKSYTVTKGDTLNLNFTVTAGGENGLLKAVTLKEPATDTVIERKPKEGQPDLNEVSVTFNTTLSDLSVGEHNLVVYATATNYNGDPTNEIFEFTVTVVANPGNTNKRITNEDECNYENIFKAMLQILEDKNDGDNSEYAKYEWEKKCDDKKGWYTDDFLLLVMTTAWTESSWVHFLSDGTVKKYVNTDGSTDYGLMGLNDTVLREKAEGDDWLITVICDDWYYNLEYGMGNLWNAYKEACAKYTNPESIAKASYSRYNGGPDDLSRWEDNPIQQDNNFKKNYTVMSCWFEGDDGGATGAWKKVYEVFCRLYGNVDVPEKPDEPVTPDVPDTDNIVIAGVDIGYKNGQYFTVTGRACDRDKDGEEIICCHNISKSNIDCAEGGSWTDTDGIYGTPGVVYKCSCKHNFDLNGENVELGASQCVGYARYCSYMVFGGFPTAIYTNVTIDNVKEKLLQSKPGSYLHNRTKDYKHAIVLISADQNKITYTDANYTGACKIQKVTKSWAEFCEAKYIKYGSYTIYGEKADTVSITKVTETYSGDIITEGVNRDGYLSDGTTSLMFKVEVKGAKRIYMQVQTLSGGSVTGTSPYDKTITEQDVNVTTTHNWVQVIPKGTPAGKYKVIISVSNSSTRNDPAAIKDDFTFYIKVTSNGNTIVTPKPTPEDEKSVYLTELTNLLNAGGISQTEFNNRISVLEEASRYCNLEWTTQVNFSSWRSTKGGYNSNTNMIVDGISQDKYKFMIGVTYKGMPYCGDDSLSHNNMTINEFLNKINTADEPNDLQGNLTFKGVDITNTTLYGIDCAGLVLRSYKTLSNYTESYLGTGNLCKVFSPTSNPKPGDIMLKPGHVMIYAGKSAEGTIMVYESAADGDGISGCVYRIARSPEDYKFYYYNSISKE